jgi:hypothetical protein
MPAIHELDLEARAGAIRNRHLAVGLAVGVVADEAAYPDLDVFAAALRDELHQLGADMPTATGAGVGP